MRDGGLRIRTLSGSREGTKSEDAGGKQQKDQRVDRKYSSPLDGPEQSGAGLIVEGDDDAGGWKVGIIVDGRTPAKTQC